MQLEAIKINNNFMIPELDKLNLSVDKIILNVDDNTINRLKNTQKSTTYQKLELLNEELGGDELIEALLKHTPLDYEYKSNKSDDEILYEALREKYEL